MKVATRSFQRKVREVEWRIRKQKEIFTFYICPEVAKEKGLPSATKEYASRDLKAWCKRLLQTGFDKDLGLVNNPPPSPVSPPSSRPSSPSAVTVNVKQKKDKGRKRNSIKTGKLKLKFELDRSLFQRRESIVSNYPISNTQEREIEREKEKGKEKEKEKEKKRKKKRKRNKKKKKKTKKKH